MHSRIRYPDRVSQSELDDYLQAGWRCTGQAIYTSHFMRFPPETGGRIFSTIPTRLCVKGYSFRKSLRKIYRKVHQNFRVETGDPLVWDQDMEAVHSAYQSQFPDRPLADLETYQQKPNGPFTFETRCIKVYAGKELVAFSVFNLGQDSLYSSQGIYAPEWGKYSLGFFTMLEEIMYARETERSYFYPGYVVPGYPEFDYKKRIGELEFYLLQLQDWVPEKDIAEVDIPLNNIKRALTELRGQLQEAGIHSHLMEYALFDIRFFDDRPLPFLEFPLVLLIGTPDPARYCPVAVFSPEQQTYTIANIKFFGFGVHHVPTYHKIMKMKPVTVSFPIAVLENTGPLPGPAPTVALLKKEMQKASFL